MSEYLGLSGVTKFIGYRPIVKNINFQLTPGELGILTGANGAGKTTLLRIVARITPASTGTITGVESKQIAYLGHRPMIYAALTCYENLAFFAQFYSTINPDAILSTLTTVGLAKQRLMRAGQLSRGMQQRLALGRIVLSNTRLVLMDEPFTGLDSAGISWLTQLLATFQAKGRILLVVSHELSYLSGLSYRHLHLDQGKLMMDRQVHE